MSIAQQAQNLGISPSPDGGSPKNKWLKVVAWCAVVLAAVFVLSVCLLQVLLSSKRFHGFVIRSVESRASEQLHTKVDLRNYAIHLSTLELELYGLTVHGAQPHSDPPLLQVAHAQVGIRVLSVLHRKWYLDSIRIDNPVVKIYMDPHGVSNIPQFKSEGKSNTSLFDLGIRHAVLSNGEVSYNDRRSVLDADLHDLEFRSLFNSEQQTYTGHLSYANGSLRSGDLSPIAHNFEADFSATPARFQLTSARLTSGDSSLSIQATLKNYAQPIVDGRYNAVVDLSNLRTILRDSSIPLGLVRASGTVNYREIEGRPALEAVSVHGEINSQQLRVQEPSLRISISNILANYSLENGDAVIENLRATALGGEITAVGKMSRIGADSHTELQAKMRGLSLNDLRNVLGSAALPKQVSLRGTLGAQGSASWGKTLDDLVVHADATINGRAQGGHVQGNQAQAVQVADVSSSGIPIDGVIHTTYHNSSGVIEFNQSYLRTPESRLDLNGAASNNSKITVRFDSRHLEELETISAMFRSPAPGQQLQPLGLSGSASFQGTVYGSTKAPHVIGQLTAQNLHVEGSSWRTLNAGVDLSPSQASLQHAYLEPATRGHITLDATAGLNRWSFTNRSPLQLDLNASQVEVADLTRLAGSQIPLSGTLSANVKLHGTVLNPMGAGTASLTQTEIYDEPVDSVRATFSGSGNEIHADLAIHLPAGAIQGNVSIRPQQRTYVAEVTSDTIHLDQIKTLKSRELKTSGILSLHAHGEGSFDDPQFTGTVHIPQLAIADQVVNAINLQMDVSHHVATADLTSQAVSTSIRANARVNLTGDYLTDARLDTQAIPLQPIFAIYAPAQAADVKGETELHATLHGPLKQKKQLEGHLVIPTLKLSYGSNVQLAAAAPIHVDYLNGVVTLQRGSIHGTDTDLQFQGAMSIDKSVPSSLLLLGTVNLHLAQLLNPDIRSSGELKLDINSNQAGNGPDVQGQIEIVDASFANGDLPVGLQHANGLLTLTRSRLNISRFQGVVGSGTVTAQGGVAYQPSVQFDLGLAARDVRVLYPQGVRETINADLRMAGSPDNAVVGGQVNLAELSFTQAFDLNDFIGQFSGGDAPPPPPGISQNIRLNIGVHSSSALNLVSRTLSVNGSANLQVRGTAAQPVILGRVNMTNGDIILNGTRFLLTGGTIEFVNPTRTEPVVNLALNTTIQQYSINLRFNGPIDQLRTNYASDPALPAADIINLLAFGKTTEASAANPSTPANQAAESLVASQVSSQITSRVSKAAGISQLSISPVLAGGSNQGPQGANVTIQQRVTGNLFVTFSTNVASTQNQTIQGQYQISPRVSVSATRDQNGGFGFDTLIKKTW